MGYIFVGFVLLNAIAAFVLYIIFRPKIENLKDWYGFKLKCTQDEAIQKLSVRNIYDVLEYTFDKDTLIICLTHHSTSITYQLSFYLIDDITYLKVGNVNLFYPSSFIPLYIDRFFAKKIDAEIISRYDFEVITGATGSTPNP